MRLTPALEIKRASIDDAGQFSGYASTFGGPPDAYGDIIAPGAFTKSLKAHQAEGTAPALLWAHDQSQPIGVWRELAEDGDGLRVTGRLTLEVEKAREAHALMKSGALALSIGFLVPDGGARQSGQVRELREVDLFEISTVALPANRKARISEVKSIRDFESVLRDELGFSSRQARKLASGGWAALQGRDGSDEQDELLMRDLKTKARELHNLIARIR